MTHSMASRAQTPLATVAAVAFATYCLNVALAKTARLLGLSVPLLPDLAEFLLLLVATACFMLYALCREANGQKSDTSEQRID